MPWAHGDDYMEVKNAELKHLLELRGLPHSGNKVKMASRLRKHDHDHAFPFRRLPGEVRNMIYRLVSSGQDSILSIGQERPGEGHSEGTYCFEGFKNVLLRSSLFRVCRQTREGLAFFYEQHCIKLFVEHGGCLVAFIDWLDIMGRENAQRIRHLEIHFKTKCCKSDKIHMDRIHERLSDQATVVYIPNDVEDLWYIGRAYYLEHLQSGRAPLFKVVGISFNGSHFYNMETRDYRTGPWFRFLARKGSSMEYSMAFNPGESWFG